MMQNHHIHYWRKKNQPTTQKNKKKKPRLTHNQTHTPSCFIFVIKQTLNRRLD